MEQLFQFFEKSKVVFAVTPDRKRAELDQEIEITSARVEVRTGRRAEDFKALDVVAPAEFGNLGARLLKFYDHAEDFPPPEVAATELSNKSITLISWYQFSFCRASAAAQSLSPDLEYLLNSLRVTNPNPFWLSGLDHLFHGNCVA